MSNDLTKLIEAARDVVMTEAERERQRESFAFGNANIENQYVTRETVRQVAAEMKASGRR